MSWQNDFILDKISPSISLDFWILGAASGVAKPFCVSVAKKVCLTKCVGFVLSDYQVDRGGGVVRFYIQAHIPDSSFNHQNQAQLMVCIIASSSMFGESVRRVWNQSAEILPPRSLPSTLILLATPYSQSSTSSDIQLCDREIDGAKPRSLSSECWQYALLIGADLKETCAAINLEE